MALTVTNTVLDHPGGIRFSHGVITGDSSYAVGGEDITPDDLGFASSISSLILGPADTGYVARWDSDNNTVEVFSAGDAVNARTYSATGAAAGNVTVTGVLLTDTLVSVLHYTSSVAPIVKEVAFDGGAAGNHTATGVASSDDLISVVQYVAPSTRTYAINGTSAGNHTVTGVIASDTLISVVHHTVTTAAVADLTSEFTVSANDQINNTGNTDTTNDFLVVTVETAGDVVDLTSEFTVSGANQVNNAAGTNTTGDWLVATTQVSPAEHLIADLTSEFTISANNQINNAAGTSSANDLLVVTTSRASAFSEVDATVDLSSADFTYIAVGY